LTHRDRSEYKTHSSVMAVCKSVTIPGMTGHVRRNTHKQALMSQMLEEIARIAGITAEDVWIYLQDIPATQMIEFGRFLPAPGDEAEWERGMTPGKRTRLPD